MSTIDDYIAGFEPTVQAMLQEMRKTIKEAAPDAKEKITYGMPTFYQGKNLVHFAAFKNHIGFYPTPSGIEHFERQLACYKSSKGAVQFPLDRPLPLELVKEITAYRVDEEMNRNSKG